MTAVIIATVLAVLCIVGAIARYVWWHATYCPSGKKHRWKFRTWYSWYFRPDPGFTIVGPAHHTDVAYLYECMDCGRERRINRSYFGVHYRPTREDWEWAETYDGPDDLNYQAGR